MNLSKHLFLASENECYYSQKTHAPLNIHLFLSLFQMRGEAEAFALEAKGRAEAEQMAKKAEAFKQYKEGAMVDMLLEKLPLVSASEILSVHE